ncbi:DUF3857 domain-containing protein [Flavobacterium sp.]|uniref:DUF3857 domain-containing protein n=1 Tax=Flavobacterium sp. TaxID=239 RepID=UPI00262EF8E4|nr:DUF3857 domain-containing protein [Flavobacterium sp.]
MNNLKKTLVLMLLFSMNYLQAQRIDLEKVSVAAIQEKTHPTDSSAAAAILYKKARTYFIYEDKRGFSVRHEYTYRIKIYKKEGLSWANFKVPYYVAYENLPDEAVKFSNGTTYNLENGAIVKTKLNSEGNFKKNVNEYWNEASITMPNVKVGSIIEFQYTLSSDNIVKFPVFDFQYDIPVNSAVYSTEVPEYFSYNSVLKGFFKVKSESKIDKGYQNFTNEYNQTVNLSFQQINTLYTAENVPALRDEDYVDNIDNYKSAVVHELEKTRFPEVPEKIFAKSWLDVTRSIYKFDDFGKELNLKGYFETDLKMIVQDDASETDKINAVFKFVQQKMNWNGTYGYGTDKGVKKAYQEGSGNIADINFILISMLNYSGLNANPVLVSTVDHGIPVFPNRTVFNYVIAAVDIQGKRVLLDASNKFTAPNILRFSALNWMGRLVRSDGSSDEINLIPSVPSKETNNIMASIDASGKITAKMRVQTSDYLALQFRQKYGNVNQESYLEKLEQDLKDSRIEGYTVENKLTDLSKPIVETFTLASENLVEVSAGRMEFDPLLFFTMTKNPFQQENRILPVYFGYPKHYKYNISFDIPEGYAIESLPKSITLATPENIEVFSYKVMSQDNKIQLVATLENNGTLLAADFYEALKAFYLKVIEKQSEKIILKKI